MFLNLPYKIFFVWCLSAFYFVIAEVDDNTKPYEFSFDIVDFQHRYEKKNADGTITGEYGFITADGVYHETTYATDETGNFVITKMTNRKIKSIKDADELFKDKPLVAKKLSNELTRACSGCKLPEEKIEETTTKQVEKNMTLSLGKKMNKITKEMIKTLLKAKTPDSGKANTRNKSNEQNTEIIEELNSKNDINYDTIYNMIEAGKKVLNEVDDLNTKSSEILVSNEALQKLANDLFYSFNYIITSHKHYEDGYRNGSRDGSYSSKNQDGTTTHVKYVSNEFGHQPNISLLPKHETDNNSNNETTLKGYAFNWYRN